MTDPIFSDDTLRTAKYALDGLGKRQEVIGQNLANIDTPGYQAQGLNFENTLKRAIHQPQRGRLQLTHANHMLSKSEEEEMRLQTVSRPGSGWRTDGNNVDIDTELSEMAETGIRYQALTQLISKKFLLLKAIGTGR
jgi:flagellar basal-body rod protein FlgB